MEKNTTEYYEVNSKTFIESTLNVDMSVQYNAFEKYLNNKGCILDLGFGSGRDSLYFVNKGYTVYAIDPSESFCDHARQLGIENVFQMTAQEMTFEDQFDGIWACASLLHVPYCELPKVFKLCKKALKKDGILYASFKIGDYEGERNGRYFTDMTLDKLNEVLLDTELTIIETFENKDNRPDREERWLNVVLRNSL